MDIFYALGMNLTKKTTVKYGQTDDTEKAYKKFDEVVALVQQAVKEPVYWHTNAIRTNDLCLVTSRDNQLDYDSF